MNKPCKILIIEPSVIIREGIIAIIENIKDQMELLHVDTVEEALKTGQPELLKMVLVNPITFSNSKVTLSKFQLFFNQQNIIGLISNHYDRNLHKNFTDNIFITDSFDTISNILAKHFASAPQPLNDNDSALSEREIDVLKLLAIGKANKEIAEELFISIHTVISHRKNISNKLGVKSTAALVIYAVANGLVDVDGFSI
ncbi:helix-turn-helix transcriptional regulator [uncultured Draconibacterium sp.]|uniref:response regulator transcription factor n=1 Tax=uncultured Draconibacterium sp. TaxID=1573823 RepID=UPI003261B014